MLGKMSSKTIAVLFIITSVIMHHSTNHGIRVNEENSPNSVGIAFFMVYHTIFH